MLHMQMHCLIGAITFFNQRFGSQSHRSGLPQRTSKYKDRTYRLNGVFKATPVFKWYLNDLQINLPNKSYSRDNRLNKNQAHIQILVWHLDVGFLGLE